MADLSGVEHALAVKLHDVAEEYVPYRTGRLTNTAAVEGNKLKYTQPYARRLYFVGTIEYEAEHPEKKFDPYREKWHFSRAVHPKAQSFWVWGARKDHASELGTFAAQEIRKELRRNG